jgi:hypothetical protein
MAGAELRRSEYGRRLARRRASRPSAAPRSAGPPGVIDGVLSPKVIDQINSIPDTDLTVVPEPKPTPEPTPGPIIKTPSSSGTDCRQVGLAWVPGNADYEHIADRHAATATGSQGKWDPYIFSDANDHGLLDGLLAAGLRSPRLVANQNTEETGQAADCYFEATAGDNIGTAQWNNNRVDAPNYAIALRSADSAVVTAYPCRLRTYGACAQK